MAAQSVIITNPNSSSRLFGGNTYLNRYSSEFISSESSDSSGNLESVPVQMQNISSTSYSGILNESFETIDPEQRRQIQYRDPGEPYLTILEQPKNQLRFRYKSEKGKHGGLKPIVQLNNFQQSGEIYIKVSLYTNEDNPKEHVFDLEAKSSENGNIQQKLKDGMAKFSSLSVYTKKKDEILSLLEKRIKARYKEQKKKINETAIKREAQEEIKQLNLNAGRLCFETLQDNKPICKKIFSEPFYDQKCTSAGDLKIIRLSSCSGKASGGDDVILLCDKIRKDNIEIHFFEENDEGKIVWEGKGEFNPGDVHHQVAIPFKTPQFRGNVEKKVSIHLYRKSDQKFGETIDFLFIKDEQYNYDFSARSSKRKKTNVAENIPNELITENANLFTELPSTGIDLDFLSGIDFNFDVLPDLPDLPDYASENVTMDGVVSSVSSTLSKTKIQNTTEKKKSSLSPSITPHQVKDIRNWISDILKTLDINSFLKCLPILTQIEDEENNTLLHLVIEKSENLLFLLRLLQVFPKDMINRANKWHLTPLHLAVSKGLWKHVRLLLMFGANPKSKNQEGSNCVHLATKYNFRQCLFEVLAPLLCEKRKSIIPDINALNYEGFAPIHLSVMNESEECIKLLVQANANINITDGKCGKTPLHMAYDLKNPKLLEYLNSQPKINRSAMDFRGSAPCSVITYAKSESRNTKPTECCIDISSDSNNSEEKENKNFKENSVSVEELPPIVEDLEDKLLEKLSLNELWKKLGIYLMEETELDMIEDLEDVPAKTILKIFKKKHKENYLRELKKTLSNDAALKHVYKQLQMSQL